MKSLLLLACLSLPAQAEAGMIKEPKASKPALNKDQIDQPVPTTIDRRYLDVSSLLNPPYGMPQPTLDPEKPLGCKKAWLTNAGNMSKKLEPNHQQLDRPRKKSESLKRAVSGDVHPIVVRVSNGDGKFVDRRNGKQFTPRGNNYVDLEPQQIPFTATGETSRSHAAFNPGVYNHQRIDGILAKMQTFDYNVVRVFISDWRVGSPCGGLSRQYLENVADFLKLAKRHKILVYIAVSGLPAYGGYREKSGMYSRGDINGRNALYLTQQGIDQKKRYIKDFIGGLIELKTPMDSIFAYSIENEQYYEMENRPLVYRNQDKIETPAGTYSPHGDYGPYKVGWNDMLDDNLVNWSNELTATIKKLDPAALVGVGFFRDLYDWENPLGMLSRPYKVVADPKDGGSRVDFVDLHYYADPDVTMDNKMARLGASSTMSKRKPRLMGEFGASRSQYNDLGDAANAVLKLQIDSCSEYNFDGWILWTWEPAVYDDFPNQFYWPATDFSGRPTLMNDKLAPAHRLDPCTDIESSKVPSKVAGSSTAARAL